MHKRLERQLQELNIATDRESTPSLEQWRKLLEYVEESYVQSDRIRDDLEHALSLALAEMQALDEEHTQKKDKLRAIFESAAVGILSIDADGYIVDSNLTSMSMLGLTRDQLNGRKLASFFEQDAPASLGRPGASGARTAEHFYRHPAGRNAWFHTTETLVTDACGTIRFGTIILEDVTEQKHLEGTLRHAQKLEAVGRLAAGIAHEINTPIQFVNDNVHFMRDSFAAVVGLVECLKTEMAAHGDELLARYRKAEEQADWEYLGDEFPKSISQTLDGLQRVATIVHSMKSFAHEDRGEQAPADLNAALASTLTVASHELKGIAVAVRDFGELPPVVCFRGDLNQVFLNLVVNAAHAISDVVGTTGKLGRITVSTRRDGNDVVVSIADTGGGIPNGVAEKMFDPFFTTKEVGRGSGQGLALARNIVVKKHRGTITFESQLGVGTTFVIRLPIAGARETGARAA